MLLPIISLRQLLIHLHQLRHTLALCYLFVKTIRLHDGEIILLVSLAEVGRHSCFVVEVSEGAVGIFCPSVEDSLSGLFDFLFLFGSGAAPREIIVNDVFGIAVVAFQSSANRPHPSHMDI